MICEHPEHSSFSRLLGVLRDFLVGGTQIVLALLTAPVLRRWYNHWGATPDEQERSLPGDDLVPDPKLGYTRAVTIDASASDVWAWLVQFGQGKGGFYSFDALENVVGCRIHSVDRILPEHQSLARGDLIRSGPTEKYPSWEVLDVAPAHHLVLMGADPDTMEAPPVVETVPEKDYVGTTWQWFLDRAGGGGSTRLVVRQRLTYSPNQALLWHLVEPFNFVMERQMMLGLKRRAERHHCAAMPGPGSAAGSSSTQT